MSDNEIEKNDKYEVSSLVDAIKRVEMAKQKKPELYQKAMAELGDEVKTISSIADLKKIRDKKNMEKADADV